MGAKTAVEALVESSLSYDPDVNVEISDRILREPDDLKTYEILASILKVGEILLPSTMRKKGLSLEAAKRTAILGLFNDMKWPFRPSDNMPLAKATVDKWVEEGGNEMPPTLLLHHAFMATQTFGVYKTLNDFYSKMMQPHVVKRAESFDKNFERLYRLP